MKYQPRRAEVVSSFFLEISKVLVEVTAGSRAVVRVTIRTTQMDHPRQGPRRGWETGRHQEVDRRPCVRGNQAGATVCT